MTKEDKIILVCGGSHYRSCIDVIEQEGRFTIAGTIVMHKALVNAGAAIRKNFIVNTGALIENDNKSNLTTPR